MEYSKEFERLLKKCITTNQYVGLGNPNANILFIGKEAGFDSNDQNKARDYRNNANTWNSGSNLYATAFLPELDSPLRNLNHTWQKYQKLYDDICRHDSSKDLRITFVENVFTTELSNLPSPNTNDAKRQKEFYSELKIRKDVFFNDKFINQFPIVIIFASDNKYIETYPGEVCEMFGVNYFESHVCSISNKLWIHYAVDEKNEVYPKLVIHTRQLTNGASLDLIKSIAELIRVFAEKHNIKLCNRNKLE